MNLFEILATNSQGLPDTWIEVAGLGVLLFGIAAIVWAINR